MQTALGALVTRGLVELHGARVVFVHPLLQEVVYAGIPVDARREFHARRVRFAFTTYCASVGPQAVKAMPGWYRL